MLAPGPRGGFARGCKWIEVPADGRRQFVVHARFRDEMSILDAGLCSINTSIQHSTCNTILRTMYYSRFSSTVRARARSGANLILVLLPVLSALSVLLVVLVLVVVQVGEPT
jgi:hypothetical protein